jgi:alkaline phosphatase
MSQKKYENDYVSKYIKDSTPVEEVIKDAEKIFGLNNMTEEEKEKITYAYSLTLAGNSSYTSEDWEEFSDNLPLCVTLSNILSRRAGLSASTFFHTASPVGVWALGVGEEKFSGFYDNTDIYKKITSKD